jgi:hypothetical protein
MKKLSKKLSGKQSGPLSWKEETMKNLSDREQNIVLATIRLWNINAKRGYVPDYELIEPAFDLPMEAMRDIRNLVQDVRQPTPSMSRER